MSSEMNGKVVLVTGATAGIGKVTARELADKGATVVIVGRNEAKTRQVVAEIKGQTGNDNVDYLIADLSLMAQVYQLADDFKARYDHLDVLINNAGSIFFERGETSEGIEKTIALNHLSPFLLTNLLLETIKASAPARIITLSSNAHNAGQIDFEDLQGKRKYGGFNNYAHSKLANVMFTYELARRLEGTGVTANAVHPGVVRTNFGKTNNQQWWTGIFTGIFGLFAVDEEEGAKTGIYVASSPDVEGVTGKYFAKSQIADTASQSKDIDAQKRLWEISEQMVGLTVTV